MDAGVIETLAQMEQELRKDIAVEQRHVDDWADSSNGELRYAAKEYRRRVEEFTIRADALAEAQRALAQMETLKRFFDVVRELHYGRMPADVQEAHDAVLAALTPAKE